MNQLVSRIVARWKSANPWTIAMAFFLSLLFIVLAVRAADEYRWSDWGFGDAQTMLSLRQWEEGGWFKNYLLFKPQGYAKVVELFDDPELRHHAHGTCPGSSPRVGPRLWYTHYPAGYLIPYAMLFRIGLDSLFAVRLFSLLLSFSALVLMYVLFARLTAPAPAFIAVLFYALSSSFLGYADSLANQPIDDLLRFAFMLAIVLSTRAVSAAHRKDWAVAAWCIEFALSLTSFDSVFFVYVWLIGWDVLERRGFRWKVYLVYGLAPVLAHGLQFLQNIWYLGFEDAVIDIKDAFLLKHGADQGYNVGQGRFGVILTSIAILFDNLHRPSWVLAAVLGAYLLHRRFLSGTDDQGMPSPGLLAVLFLCGLSFVLVLPHAARMPYEARQMLPFAALLVAGFTWSVIRQFRESLQGQRTDDRTVARAAVAYLITASSLLLVLWFGFLFSERKVVYDVKRIKHEISFARELDRLETRYEPVFFDAGGFSVFWDPNYVPGYPQILPITEYYAGSKPILCFTATEGMTRDLVYLIRNGNDRFSPVLVATEPGVLREAVSRLNESGVLMELPQTMNQMQGRFVIDLTDFIRWERT